MRDRAWHALARRWWAGELGTAGTLLDVLLAPAEALYRVGIAARNRAFAAGLLRTQHATIPVISVGNIAVGGTGKTPFAQHLARMLRERGARPAILHGGYAADEPALHRHWSPDIPVIVDRDRVRGAATAGKHGADVIVLDDGFQHRRLHRDLDIVLVAVERWKGAHRLLPRGPAREPRSALHRADLLVTTRKVGPAVHAGAVRRQLEAVARAPVISLHLEPAGWIRGGVQSGPPAAPAVAVTALAEPELFVAAARATGATIRDVLDYPDHHAYSTADAADILRTAGDDPIVTTEKDWIKLHALLPGERVWALTQRVRVDHGADVLDARLNHVLSARKPTASRTQ